MHRPLVILPALPLPETFTEDMDIFFSLKILEAAGDGVPLAKLFSRNNFFGFFQLDLMTSHLGSLLDLLYFILGAFSGSVN